MLRGGVTKMRAKNSLYNGLLGWWRLDESSGNALDSSGNDYQGTVNGATQDVTGHIRTAYDFDGVNDNVDITDSGLMTSLQGLSAFTVSFWAAVTSYEADEAAFGMGEEGTNDVLSIYPYQDGGKKGDQIEVWYDGESIIAESNTTPADGSFHNFVFVQTSATEHEIFIDGVSAGTDTTSKTLAASTDIVNIGSYDGNEEYFDGIVDHVQIWDRALTDAEVDLLSDY